jgi:hypothetical protein
MIMIKSKDLKLNAQRFTHGSFASPLRNDGAKNFSLTNGFHFFKLLCQQWWNLMSSFDF